MISAKGLGQAVEVPQDGRSGLKILTSVEGLSEIYKGTVLVLGAFLFPSEHTQTYKEKSRNMQSCSIETMTPR